MEQGYTNHDFEDVSLFEEIFPEQFRFFADTIDKGRISGAYLFWGKDGIGKTSFALFFARSALCGIMPYCTFCKSCSYNEHPDILLVKKGDEDERLKVELIRDAIRFSYIPPIFGRKFVIIKSAHLLTQQGFSALLKTIEEPKPFTTFILISEKIDVIPLTILSRCIRIKFVPHKNALEKLIRKRIREKFGNISDDLESMLISVLFEKPSLIERIDSGEELMILWDMIKLFFLGISDNSSRFELFEKVQEFCSERDRARLFLDFLESYVSSNLHRFGANSVSIWEKLKNARRKIEIFINPKIVLSELILS